MTKQIILLITKTFLTAYLYGSGKVSYTDGEGCQGPTCSWGEIQHLIYKVVHRISRRGHSHVRCYTDGAAIHGQFRGSVSCPRTLQHDTLICGQPAVLPEPQLS